MTESRNCATCAAWVGDKCIRPFPPNPGLTCWRPSFDFLQKEYPRLHHRIADLEAQLGSLEKEGYRPTFKTVDNAGLLVRCSVFRIEHGSPPSVWVDPAEVKDTLKKAGKE